MLSRPSLFSPRWRRQLVTYFLSIQPVVILTFNSKRVQVRPVHVTYTSTCYLFEIIDSSVVSDKCKQMALCHVGPTQTRNKFIMRIFDSKGDIPCRAYKLRVSRLTRFRGCIGATSATSSVSMALRCAM